MGEDETQSGEETVTQAAVTAQEPADVSATEPAESNQIVEALEAPAVEAVPQAGTPAEDSGISVMGVSTLAGPNDWNYTDFTYKTDPANSSRSIITGFSATGLYKLNTLHYTDVWLPEYYWTRTISGVAEGAFKDRAMTSVHIPVANGNSYTFIEKNAFQNAGLTTLVIYKSRTTAYTFPTLTTLGEGAFIGNKLKDYDNKGTATTDDDEGFDFNSLFALSSGTLPKNVFKQNEFTKLALPANITTIGEGAFYGNKITQILPGGLDNVTAIGAQAFVNNQLTQLSLTSATTSIAADAFNSNGRVVKITMPDPHTGVSSHFTAGSGYIINPVTITVTPADKDTLDPIGSPFDIGNDFSSDVLFERGAAATVQAPAYAGYVVVTDNASYPAPRTIPAAGTNASDPDHENVTFLYKPAAANPVISANDRFVTQGQAYDQTTVLSWATATDANGTSIPAQTNASVVPGLSIESIVIGGNYYGTSITASMTASVGTIIEITYKATDSNGAVSRALIRATVQSDPQLAYIPKADGTPSLWQYGDFTYANETVTVSVAKYPSGNYTESVIGMTVTGFSAAGNSKYESSSAARAYLALPGIDPTSGNAVVAISSSGAGGGTKFNSKTNANVPGAIDLSNMTALEIIGDTAFSTALDNNAGAYSDINFGNSGARLTKLRAIGDSAFRWNKVVNLDLSGLTALVLIGDFAFSDSSSNKVVDTGGHALQSIDFSNLPSLLAIGDFEGTGGRTFMNSQLRSIDLSGAPNLEQIGIAIFCSAAPNGATITIPAFPLDLSMLDKVKIIGQFAFRDYPISELNISGMDSLERIDGNNFGHLGSATLEIKDNPKLTMISPGLFSYSVSRQPYTQTSVTTLVIDNCDSLEVLHKMGTGSVGTTGDAGFDDLTALTTLVISNNDRLTTIDTGGTTPKPFNARNLTSITIENNDSLTTISSQAFSKSQSTTIVIAGNDALTDIGQEAFLINHVTTLDLSTNPMLTTIGKNAFSQNNGGGSSPSNDGGSYLTSLNLTGLTHLVTIGNEAFANAKLTGMLDFTSNTGLKNIGTRAFRSSAISGVAFPPSIELINIMAFAYYSGDSLVLADLPALKILGAGAFGQYNTEGSPGTLKTLELRNLPSLVNLNRADASYNGTPVESTDFKAGATIETAYCVTYGTDGIAGTNDDEAQGSSLVGGNFGNSLPNLTTLTIDNVGLRGIPPKAFYASPLTSLTIRNMPYLTNIGLYGDKNDPDSQTYAGMSYGTVNIDGSTAQ
ncbi:MAG: leucine-rich repeat domain-containing protein, partial [Clostridiales Family XIII bacterium]|nr:leucine-rich repeat domain-containing protein [Clostridiales Family XIII bacterium]